MIVDMNFYFDAGLKTYLSGKAENVLRHYRMSGKLSGFVKENILVLYLTRGPLDFRSRPITSENDIARYSGKEKSFLDEIFTALAPREKDGDYSIQVRVGTSEAPYEKIGD